MWRVGISYHQVQHMQQLPGRPLQGTRLLAKRDRGLRGLYGRKVREQPRPVELRHLRGWNVVGQRQLDVHPAADVLPDRPDRQPVVPDAEPERSPHDLRH